MKSTMAMSVALVVLSTAVPNAALAQDEARSPGFTTNSNSPEPFGSGYDSWGTRGGATLGQGMGLRAGIATGGGVNNAGLPWAGLGWL